MRKPQSNRASVQPQAAVKQRTCPPLLPKTDRQRELIEQINHHAVVICSGPAGCGKSYVSAAMAAKYYTKGYVDKIILSRANVPTGKTLGHFPGTVEDKLTPWLMPVLDVLQKFMPDGLFKYCVEKKIIQMQPIETIRGRSFENAFIIVDEAQNLDRDSVISITTRLGENSKLILSGDPFQTDVKGVNGLTWFDNFAQKYNLNIPAVHFDIDDVVRSKIVKEILVALYAEFDVKT